MPSERSASPNVCMAGEPIPPQSPRLYSHRPKLFFATTTAAFGVVDPRGWGVRAAPCIPRTENAIRFAVALCFLPFFSHGHRKKKKK